MKYLVSTTGIEHQCLIKLIPETMEEILLLGEADFDDEKQYDAISFHYTQAIKENFGAAFDLVAIFPNDDYPKSGLAVYKVLTN